MAPRKRRKPTEHEVKAAADRAEGKAVEDVPEYDPLEPEEVAPKMGRPTIYDPECVANVKEWAENGATDHEIAQNLGIHRATFYEWASKHKAFSDALRIGKLTADRRVERSMHHRAVGYDYHAVKIFQNNGEPVIVPYVEHVPPDVGAGKLWLFNRQKKRWSDSSKTEITGKDGGPVQIEGSGNELEFARRLIFALAQAKKSLAAPATIEHEEENA